MRTVEPFSPQDAGKKQPLSILYRGFLSSCNYSCHYCPFAKHQETRAEHERDARALERFVAWLEQATDFQLSIFFTPWGEALIQRRYQDAISQLSQLSHVKKVAIQSNISGKMRWLESCVKEKVALWATYHPSQLSRTRFLAKCAVLHAQGVAFSVGAVGLRDNIADIEALRRDLDKLDSSIYLWVNAYDRAKSSKSYYSPELLARLEAIDPLFSLNNRRYASRGKACRTGESVISVDGTGAVRRCHFVDRVLGNLYQPDFSQVLQARACPRAFCDCHIGYVHMPELKLYDIFAEGVLERIPYNLTHTTLLTE